MNAFSVRKNSIRETLHGECLMSFPHSGDKSKSDKKTKEKRSWNCRAVWLGTSSAGVIFQLVMKKRLGTEDPANTGYRKGGGVGPARLVKRQSTGLITLCRGDERRGLAISR